MRVLYVGQLVIVGDVLRHQRHAVVVIQAADVVLHVVHQRVPVVVNLGNVPAERGSVANKLADDGGLVHQLLGNATDIHARTSETPSGSLRRGLYIIK